MARLTRMLLTGLCLGSVAPVAAAPSEVSVTKADVVIDPGHGGTNTGSPGRGELLEKQATLAISKAVARELREAGLVVALTRTRDEYVPLRARARLANALSPRCFVSIHTNASPDHSRHGIETYLLSRDAIDVHAHLAAQLAPDDGAAILAEQHVLATARESLRLAEMVQKHLLGGTSTTDGRAYFATDRGVRQASHDVLADAEVPAILVEAGFLDHPIEGRMLASAAGQASTAHLIASGILAYVRQQKDQPVATNGQGPIAFARAR
ncbi:MAG: N-acetylmuramoyl-L-alanine amidase [Polyangia bacterium]